MKSFGDLLVGFRRAAGLTQEDLAGATGLSVRAISDLERGRRSRPQVRTVEILAEALGLRGAAAAQFLSTARPVTAGGPAGQVPFDRDEQWARLRRLADVARSGHGSVALVRGTAGMGKTSLLEAWTGAELAAGMRVAWATGAEPEQGFGFAVVQQLLQPVAAEADTTRLLASGGEPAHEVMHGLYRLVVRACDEGPLMLVVDDGQWVDSPSLRWLDYLSRRIGGLPLVLVVAARPERGAVERLDGEVIMLPGLSPTAVTRWVRQEWPGAAEEFCHACAEAADGNPSVLSELLAALRTRGVAPVADQVPLVARVADQLVAGAVVRRLARQDETTRRLARALAVLGDGHDWPLVAALSGLSDAECRDRADRLRRLDVLAAGDAAQFRRPAVRPILAEAMMSPEELAAGHARAAELLYAAGAPAERVAEHLLAAEPGAGSWHVEALREAARAARGRGAPEAGGRYLRRALREPVSVEVRAGLVLELGADEVVSDPEAAARRLALALPGLTDPLTRAEASSLLAEALLVGYRHDEAMDVLERAVADAEEPAGSDGLVRETWLRLQAQAVLAGYQRPATLPAARRRAERLRAFDVAGDTPGQRAVLRALAAPAMLGEGDAATVNDLLDRGLRGEVPTDARAARMLGFAGLGYALTDRLDDAALRYRQMRDVAERYGAASSAAYATAGLSDVAWRRGERIPVVPPFEGAFLTDVPARVSLLTVALHSLVERGDPEAATALLAEHASGDAVDSALWAPVLVTAGRVQAESGDLSGALALLMMYGGLERQVGLGNPAATPWRTGAARICAALGQREQARELATEELEAAHRWGTARVIGAGLRCLGAVVGGAEGRALLAEAVAALETSPARLELAWARYEWALAVRQGGDPRAAVGILGETLKAADLSGARLLAGRVRAELVAAGVRVDPAPAVTDI